MKRAILPALALLSACSALQQPAPVTPPPAAPAHPAPQPPGKVELLLGQANKLADRVKSGELTRAAAADQLGAYRVKLVGHNPVDDNTYALYRHLSAERDAGRLDGAASQAQMEALLREWLRRWPKLTPRPAEPAFTNFLLKLYGLPPLGR